MKKKMGSIFLIMLLIIASLQIMIFKEPNTLADPEEGGEEDGYLDFDYYFDTVSYLSNIIHDGTVYSLGEIKKGRYFGSDGDKAAADFIFYNFTRSCGFDENDVRQVALGYVQNASFKHNYTEFVEVTSYELTINHDQFLNETGLPSATIPQDDFYPLVAVRDPEAQGNYTMNTIFNNNIVINEFDLSELFPKWQYGIQPYNVTYDALNDYGFILGNVTYVAAQEEIPTHDFHTVFLLDEVDGVEYQIENATKASGVILLRNTSRNYTFPNADDYYFSITRVDTENEANNQNLTAVKQLLENGSIVIADNTSFANKITFVHNLSAPECGPNQDFVVLYNATNQLNFGLLDIIISCNIQYLLNFIRRTICEDVCSGIIIYDDRVPNCHMMYNQFIETPRFNANRLPMFALPGFSVNKTIGKFLQNHSGQVSNNISGHVYQIHHKETPTVPGLLAYNVEADLHIAHSPNDSIIILSSRYDSMWQECSGDSAAGNGIIMGVSKYMQQLNQTGIKPKYNVTFLMTTNEENGYYGAQFYNDTHNTDNIIMWIGTDQLGFNNGTLHNVYKNATHRSIVENITILLNYTGKTGYEMDHDTAEEIDDANFLSIPSYYTKNINGRLGCGAEDVVFFDRENCDTILIHKGDPWPNHHHRGAALTQGDVLANFDWNDAFMFYNITWETVKYFLYDPDCHFHSVTYEAENSTGGTAPDSLKATFTVKSVLPNDLVMINASLYDASSGLVVDNTTLNFTVNRTGVERSVTFSIPANVTEGDYYITLEVYNSTGRINKIVNISDQVNDTDTSPTFHLNRYHTLGDIRIGTTTSSVQDIIRGSRFTVPEDALVHNITAYVYSFSAPQYRATYQCMIYRVSDGHLMGATDQKKPYITGWCTFSFDPLPVLRKDTQYILSVWGDNENAAVYATSQSQSNDYHNASYTFGTPPQEIEWEERVAPYQYSIFCRYTLDIYPPEIVNVSHTPDTVGFGGNIIISANVTDNMSGVNLVKVRIGEPGGREGNYTMTRISGDLYRYVFTDTWLVGQYNYSIWAQDNETNSNTSATYHFHVSANATIAVCTIQDNYSNNEYINLTDPPGDTGSEVFGAPTDDDDGPLFTTVTVTEGNNGITVDSGDGILWNFARGTAGYTEILTANHTVIVSREQWELQCLHNTQWQLIGEPTGVSCWQPYPSEVYINRSYIDNSGTGFIVQYLFVGGCRPKISFIGDIETTARYRIVWKAAGITTDHIEHNTDGAQVRIWDDGTLGFSFNYSDVLEEYGDITQVNLQGSAENHTMTVVFDVGVLNTGGFVLDPWFGYEGNSYTGSSTIEDFIKGCTAACPLNGTADAINVALSGWNAGEKVRCVLWRETSATGTFTKAGETVERTTGGAPAWYTFTFGGTKPVLIRDAVYWLSVIADNPVLIAYKTSASGYMTYGDDAYAYEDTLPNSFSPDTSFTDVAVLINCTYTVNNQPCVGDPYPADGTEGVGIMPTLNSTVSDPEGDLMNITWYSNASGDWAAFGVNTGVVNGTYHQVFSNASTNGQWWFWKVNVTDGVYHVESPVYTFYTGCQSKIVNTGSTNISGYLLIQIQYNNSGTWVVDNDTVDETTPRTIGVGSQLALDTIFNGLVKTNDLTHGYGSYRVYAAFRDPDGDVLVCDNATELEATWEFTYTSS